MLKRYQIRNYNFKLIIFAIALSIIGILVIGSAKESVQGAQISGLVIGIVCLLALSVIDYSTILNFYWAIYVLNMVLLIAVEIFGRKIGGAQRWVVIAGIQIQPSEIAKILLILFFAQFIIKHKEKLNSFRVLATMVLLLIPPWLLIYKEPDLSTSIVILIIFCVLLFIGGLNYKIILGAFAIAIPIAVIGLVLVLQPNQQILEEYQQTRILAWLQPDKYSNTEGYQQTNSITAIGSGQLTGKGYKNNVVGSVKNGNFISEPQTDFIYAIVGEELGFLGCCTVIILLSLITVECIRIGIRAKDLAGSLVCCGMVAIIGFQSFLNMGVATGLIPNTGIPLPFVSYGRTSLVSLYMGLGIVLNIGLQPAKY